MWDLDCKESWVNWLSQRIDAFELWCRRRLLRVPRTARRSNLSIVKEISPEYSLEGLMLKLKLQYFGHLMQRVDSLEKTLMLGKIEGRRRRGSTKEGTVGWHHWFKGHESEQTPGDSEGQGSLACCNPWGHIDWLSEWLSEWTTTSFHRGHRIYFSTYCHSQPRLP